MRADVAHRIRRGVRMGRYVLRENAKGIPVNTLQVTLIHLLDDLGLRAYNRTIERGSSRAR